MKEKCSGPFLSVKSNIDMTNADTSTKRTTTRTMTTKTNITITTTVQKNKERQ